jgi:hypothetical protein
VRRPRKERYLAMLYLVGVDVHIAQSVDFIQVAESLRRLGAFWTIVNGASLEERDDA